jgi:hypothetical protein
MNKRILFVFCLLLLLSVPPIVSPGDDLSLQQILDKHAEAMGGKKAIESIHSVEISLKIQEPKYTVDGIYKADRSMRMRIDIYSDGKRVYTEAFDREKAWQMGEDGTVRDSSPEGTTALRNGIVLPRKLFGLHELANRGHKLELKGREKVDGIPYYVLKLTLDSGLVNYLYIHPQTWLIERKRDTRALHPDVDPSKIEMESRDSDYRKVDGVMYAFKNVNVDLKTGSIIQTTTVKEIKTNLPFEDSLFKKP